MNQEGKTRLVRWDQVQALSGEERRTPRRGPIHYFIPKKTNDWGITALRCIVGSGLCCSAICGPNHLASTPAP
jgi:hypothetical protein